MAKKPIAAKPVKKPELVKKPKPVKIKPGKKPKLAGKPKPQRKPEHAKILKAVKRTSEKPDMANNNSLNVTVVCPVTMMDAGNQFALTVGLTPADVDTFGKVIKTFGGVDYAVANLSTRATFMYVPYADLTDDAAEKGADLALAEKAQDALVVWGGDGDIPAPTPTTLTVIVQPMYRGAGKAALAMLEAA